MRARIMFGIVAILALIGMGCVSARADGPKYMTPEVLAKIKVGQTTQAEVESLLGKPIRSKKHKDQVMLTYDGVQKGNGAGDAALWVIPPAVAARAAGLPGLGADVVVAVVESIKERKESHYLTYSLIEIDIGKDGKVGNFQTTLANTTNRVDITMVDQIRPGVTTYAQLAPLLGALPEMSKVEEKRRYDSWSFNRCQFLTLDVISRQDGVVDWVVEYFRGAPGPLKDSAIRNFRAPLGPPKLVSVSAGDLAGIKEQQTTREAAESILGSPWLIARNAQGSFYSYSIYTGTSAHFTGMAFYNHTENIEFVYVQYNDAGLVTRLILKPLKTGMKFNEIGDFAMDMLPSSE